MMNNLFLFLLAASASAFSPQQFGSSRLTALKSSDAAEVALDPFEAFSRDASDIAIKDLAIGEGEIVNEGDVATVKYVGRLFANQQQFGTMDSLPVKMGKGDLVKGFEQAILGRKVGSEFIVRIPASLAWADRGKLSPSTGRQVIPPGSEIEFEVEILNVSNGIMGEIELFGKDRVATLIFCLSLSASAPQIEIILNKVLHAMN
jgi:peptidylprolyl isomerase